MILDRPDTPRPSLLARGDVLPMMDQYLIQIMKRNYAPIPVIVGPRGSGRTAVLKEVSERQGVVGRSVGYGSVKTGLGQALVDAVASLAASLANRRPGCTSLGRLIAAGDEFAKKSPDEGTVAIFGQACDYLLYALSNEVTEIPGGFVIFLDDLHRANESRLRVFVEGVVALGQTGDPLPFVFARMLDHPTKRPEEGLQEVSLRPLGTSDIADLAERVGLSLDSAAIKVLSDYTQGLPGPIHDLLGRCSGTHQLTADSVTEAIAAYETDQAEEVEINEPHEFSHKPVPVEPVSVLPPPSAGTLLRPKTPKGADLAETLAADQARSAAANAAAAFAGTPQAPEVAPPVPAAATGPDTDSSLTSQKLSAFNKRLPVPTPAPAPAPAAPAAVVAPVAVVAPPVAAAPAPAVVPEVAEAAPIVLTPTQKRVVESIVEMGADGTPVTLALLRRKLGDVSRFGGGATPVVAAVKELGAYGAVTHSADDVVTFTPLGVSLAAASV
jgi:hypothetical protein